MYASECCSLMITGIESTIDADSIFFTMMPSVYKKCYVAS
jgi:hypothetical protein